MNYYQHHIGDYDSHTSHLTWLEDMAYRRLLCLYYRTEKPLSLDCGVLFRLIRATTGNEKKAASQVLSEFFIKMDDGYHSIRCDNEIKAYEVKAAKNKENGARGGRPKKEPNNNPPETDWVNLGFDMETQTKGNQEPVTINQEPEPITNNQVKEHGDAIAPLAPKEPRFDFKKYFLENGCDPQHLKDWMEVRKKKKGVNTVSAQTEIIDQIKIAKITVHEAVRVCANNSWCGFKASWDRQDSKPQEAYKGNVNAAFGNPQMQPPSQEEIDEMAALQAEFKRRHG